VRDGWGWLSGLSSVAWVLDLSLATAKDSLDLNSLGAYGAGAFGDGQQRGLRTAWSRIVTRGIRLGLVLCGVVGVWAMTWNGERPLRAAESVLLTSVGLQVGQPLPNVLLYRSSGEPLALQGRKPHFTVYLSGCNTCQIFLGKVDSFEQIARDFADAPVQFFYLHKGVVHPELRNLQQPYTVRERRLLIEQFSTELPGEIPWLADGPSGELARIWGSSLPNLQLVVDPRGRVLQALEWSDPAALRRLLESIFVDWRHSCAALASSRPAQLRQADRRTPETSVLPIEKPLYMPQLVVEPVVDDDARSYFVKLRVETERPVLKGKPGKLYLRFDLDPVYRVVWDQQGPIQSAELRTPEPIPQRVLQLPDPARTVSGHVPVEWLLDSPASREPFEVRLRYRVTDAQGQSQEAIQRFVVEWREVAG
jgi:hypothetical protein